MKVTVDEGLALLPGPPNALWPDGARSVSLLRRGDLELKIYAPTGHDPQQPHTRDEVYVVARGRSRFDNGGEVQEIATGDALFVAAGRHHRFFEFTPDFAIWVLFVGPE